MLDFQKILAKECQDNQGDVFQTDRMNNFKYPQLNTYSSQVFDRQTLPGAYGGNEFFAQSFDVAARKMRASESVQILDLKSIEQEDRELRR